MRRALGFGLIAILAACSYDWAIGQGDPAMVTPVVPSEGGAPAPAPEAGTPPPPDAAAPKDGGRDTGAPGAPVECGNDCRCQNNATCNFTCTTGLCQIECSDRSTCNIKCAPGAKCDLLCRENAKCDLDCSAGGSQCPYDCAGDAVCTGKCKQGSQCPFNCPDCNTNCAAGIGICL